MMLEMILMLTICLRSWTVGMNQMGMTTSGLKKFRAHEMCKDFEFKIVMQFSSLTQFKEAMMKHSVLNSKEVTFIKNDKKKARVVCSQNYGFFMFV